MCHASTCASNAVVKPRQGRSNAIGEMRAIGEQPGSRAVVTAAGIRSGNAGTDGFPNDGDVRRQQVNDTRSPERRGTQGPSRRARDGPAGPTDGAIEALGPPERRAQVAAAAANKPSRPPSAGVKDDPTPMGRNRQAREKDGEAHSNRPTPRQPVGKSVVLSEAQ